MPAATLRAASETNEDAQSTSSTLINGTNNHRQLNDSNGQATIITTTEHNENSINNSVIRHGFDQEIFEEDIIRFLYYSEKRHDTNARPHGESQSALLDWVGL